MLLRSRVGKSFARNPLKPIAPRRARLQLESLEERLAPTIDLIVVQGGTLDVNPVSRIFPSQVYTRMEVLTTTVPGLNHGSMYRVSGPSAYVWGSGPPNPFEPAVGPSFNQNRISGGEGFRYINDGSGLGQTDSVPVKFSDSTGFNTTTDTLVIHINSAVDAPMITQQPEGITLIASGQTATLNVAATGLGPLQYQWYSGITPNSSNPVPGATSSTFTTPVLTGGGQYLYWVQVSNSVGVANSLNATVQVNEQTTTVSQSLTGTYSWSAQDLGWQATVDRTTSDLFGIPNGGVTYAVPNAASSGNTINVSNGRGFATVGGTLTIPGHTHAGIYPATVSYAGSVVLYLAPSADTSQTLTILKADQTISGFGSLAPKNYGDGDFSIGAGVTATSDDEAGGVMFASSDPSVAVVNGSTVHIVGAGTAIITASQPGNGDWNPAPNVTQTFTVNPVPLSVSVNGTLVYGQSIPNLVPGYNGFVNGDDASSLAGTLTVSTPANSTSPVGNYPITPSGLSSTNYILTFVAGTLSVTPAALFVTANSASKNEGDALTFAGTEFTTSGLVNADVVNHVTLTSAGAGATALDGSYEIVAASAVGTGLSNYDISYFSGTLQVNEAALNGAAADLAPVSAGEASATVEIGTFTHANGVEPATNFAVMVDWSIDGHHADAAVVTQAGDGTYHVSATRPVFDTFGIYPVSVSISENDVSTLVMDSQNIVTASAVPITASEGVAFSGPVATLTDLAGTGSDLFPTIRWGDGQTSAGTVTDDGSGHFTISGTHTYAVHGTYPVVVTIANAQGNLATTPAFSAGLASWWQGEGNALDSAGSNPGTLVGGVTFAPGLVGQAFQFNGAGQYVQLPDNVFPYPTAGTGNTPFSFQTWFQTTSGGVILGQQGPDDGGGTPQGWVPAIYVDGSGLLRVQLFWSGINQVVSAQPVNNGSFHHVAVSYDGTTEQVYLDGTLLGSTSLPQYAYAATYRYQLGTGFTAGWPGGNGAYDSFAGLIDEPALYTQALSADAVHAIYAAGGAGLGTPAVVYPTPTAGLTGPADGVLYQPRSFTFTASDTADDAAAGFTYQINWGDGSPVQTVPATANNIVITETHAFTATGTLTVSVTATNQFGSQSSPVTQAAQIALAQPQADGLAVSGVGGSAGVVLTPGPTAASIEVLRDGALLGTYTPAGGQIAIYGDTSGADLARIYGVGNSANSFTLSGSTATFTAASLGQHTFTIALNNVGRVTFRGGTRGNAFTNTAATVASVLRGAAGGANTFTFAGNSMGAAATILGTGTDNTLQGPNQSNVWKISGTDAGNLNGARWRFTGIQSLVGGSAMDSFAFTTAISQVSSIDGGGGGDWLDYHAYPTAVSVDLGTGQATGVTGTVRNIQNVFGGNHGNTLVGDSQGNVLIGGSGADRITGGTGVSLLIGGRGSDTVTGGSGGDILIGGSTTYDYTGEAALLSILAEWQRTDRTYAQRIDDLKTGGGLNGSDTLVIGSTVLDDGKANTLTGGTSLTGALDWFFAGPRDRLRHDEQGEQIN